MLVAAEEPPDVLLVRAAEQLDGVLVRNLLAAGANPTFIYDKPCSDDEEDIKTALHAAIAARSPANSQKRFSVIELLLAAGADVNAKRCVRRSNCPWSARTAFEMAMNMALTNQRLLQLFLDAGADPNTKTVHRIKSSRMVGESSSHILHRAVRMHRPDAVRTLLEAKADVDSLDSEHFETDQGLCRCKEETSLHIACDAGDASMAELLIAYNADVNALRKEGWTKAGSNHGQAATYGKRRRVGSVDPGGAGGVPIQETALHTALQGGHAEIAAMLVEAGADLTQPRWHGTKQQSARELCAGDPQLLQSVCTRGLSHLSSTPRFCRETCKTPMAKELTVLKTSGQCQEHLLQFDDGSSVGPTQGWRHSGMPMPLRDSMLSNLNSSKSTPALHKSVPPSTQQGLPRIMLQKPKLNASAKITSNPLKLPKI